MTQKIMATEAATTITTAKIGVSHDMAKVHDYFLQHDGTSLDCARATGILRNCVTWYVHYLEKQDRLQVIYVGRDSTTHYLAKHYSADPKKWRQQANLQGSLKFEEE